MQSLAACWGVIPWILVGILGYVAAICGFLMAFLSYKGYLLLKGKRGRGMIIILVLVLLVMTYVAVITSGTVSAYRALLAQGYDVIVFELFKVMIMAPFLPTAFETGPLWGEIAMGWLFTGLGSFFFLRKVGREGTGKDIAVKRISDDLPR